MSESDPEPPEPPEAPRFAAWRARVLRWRPWLWPATALLLAIVAAVTLWSRMRHEVWAYYTDGDGLHADVRDDKARPVLWQDPEPQPFNESDGAKPPEPTPTDTLEAAFSADGTMMVLVREAGDGANADLYLSRWNGREWSRPEPIASINTEANERGPAFSYDGRYLYFASDRKGGSGGYDLYVARWNEREWTGIEALPGEVNSASNELGPALSPDGTLLYFSSDRDGEGEGAEDIFVADILANETAAKKVAEKKDNNKKGKKKDAPEPKPSLPPVPRFAQAEAVDSLNSKAADVQAALTSRGDHVFLASDRERNKRSGFKVYLSRVIDGQALPPEAVDLYIEKGDVTDPAVRMEGFDLLFSADQSAREKSGETEPGYRLLRSTTREVVGYTDLSRWWQFKELMGNIAWWILLAIAALIALIYILEKWQDMTSLFHKCLAGSAVLHLLGLLLAMLWLIAQQIEEDEDSNLDEVAISIDALSQEELALESIPEETTLTDTTTNLESEKVESEFGAPGFEPQDEAQPVPDAARTTKEAVLVEVQPTHSEPTEQPVPEPSKEASVLVELAATVLPEVDKPLLEERDPTEPQPVADASVDVFEPEQPMREVDKTETAAVADAAVETALAATEVTELHEPEPLVDSPKISAVEAEAAPAQPQEETPTDQPPLESTMLTALPQSEFADPSEAQFEETDPANAPANDAPVDPAQDLFSPEQAVPNLATAQAQGETVADTAVATPANAAEVGASESVASSTALENSPSKVSQSTPDESLPPANIDAGAMSGLPELALADPGAPQLEEPDPKAAGAPADPATEVFQPDASAPALATLPAQRETVADSPRANRTDTALVAAGELVAGSPVMEARPTELAASTPANAVPPPSLEPAALGALPAPTLVDPAAPMLEEVGRQAAGPPADPKQDLFNPARSVPNLATGQARRQAIADAAVSGASVAVPVANARLIASSAVTEVRPTEVSGTAPQLEPVVSGLPEPSLVDPGAPPRLEEPNRQGVAPADTAADLFKPGASVPNLATTKAGGRAIADAAVANPTGSTTVASATRDGATGAPLNPNTLESTDSLPELGGGAAAPVLVAHIPQTGLLPGELETPPNRPVGTKDLAAAIQKERGKPGLESIKQMGGSDGTEKAISEAITWLVNNQEEDGRWNTAKHGAKLNYDVGGTGMVLLCFYGWGERHDQPCKYQSNVKDALDWLLAQQREDGYLARRSGMMYSHAIATIALCEAYGVTKDPALRGPAKRAIAYTLAAQSKTRGGWRYEPGNDSDTSVTGWQYMALHSASMAGIEVPETAFAKARAFLDRMGGGKHGGLYGYRASSERSKVMVATGMFCRQLDLVPPSHPMMQESARHLKLYPMKSSKPDLYYVYYATLALFQHQGPIWQQWNERLKEILPLIQKKTGSGAGSWDPSSGMTADGGRVISTALATLSLEVYYRLLPMYGFRNTEAEAPEKKQRGE